MILQLHKDSVFCSVIGEFEFLNKAQNLLTFTRPSPNICGEQEKRVNSYVIIHSWLVRNGTLVPFQAEEETRKHTNMHGVGTKLYWTFKKDAHVAPALSPQPQH